MWWLPQAGADDWRWHYPVGCSCGSNDARCFNMAMTCGQQADESRSMELIAPVAKLACIHKTSSFAAESAYAFRSGSMLGRSVRKH